MKKTIYTMLAMLGAALGAEAATLDSADYSASGSKFEAITAEGVSLSSLNLGSADTSGTGFTITFTLNESAIAEAFGPSGERKLYSLATLTCGSLHMGVGTYINDSGVGLRLVSDEASNTAYGSSSDVFPGTYQDIRGGAGGLTTISSVLADDGYSATSNVTSMAVTYTYQDTASQVNNQTGAASQVFITYGYADGTYSTLSGYRGSFKYGDFTTPETLKVNTNLLTSIYLWDEKVDATAAAALNEAAIKAIPEPATATLSLLALAGLAARRRRK